MARVVLENLVKTFPAAGKQPAFAAVKGINLEVSDGEFMVLVGPSGCGKSTTLRMIAGLEEITSGTISIDGRVVNAVLPKDRDIAMVFQNYALYPHMSVYENLAFALRLRKLSRAEIDRRVREAAQLLGLETLLERRPKALSGGQRQRVAVGRAIVRQPKVFLFDEPLSNLDAKMRVTMRSEIARLHARLGATMIYVTHDQVEAMTMGDRICLMNEGRIVQIDEPLTLYREPRSVFAASFIGTPPMNLFRGTLRREDARVFFIESNPAESAALRIEVAEPAVKSFLNGNDRPVVLGVRPEDVRIVSMPAAPSLGRGARVELSEPMGAETFLHLSTGTTTFVARVGAEERFRAGDNVHVTLAADRAHLFDAETQDALRWGVSPCH
jgi:multiple sugar transport system ATP-binding protein